MANTESQENLLENNDDPQKLAANQKSNDQVNMGLSGKLLEETKRYWFYGFNCSEKKPDHYHCLAISNS